MSSRKGLKSYYPSIDSFFTDDSLCDVASLISNIKMANETFSHQVKFCLDTTVFYNYVLPDKLFSERQENWRQLVLEKYATFGIAKHSADFIPLTRKVVAELSSWFQFNSKAGPVYAMTYKDIVNRGGGDCISESKLGAYCLRSLGIPVSLDFTCSFGNIDGSLHMWNSIVYSEVKSVPFMAAEATPYQYDPFVVVVDKSDPMLTTKKRCAKIFRRTYRYANVGIDETIVPNDVTEVLKDNRFRDVTDLYQSVSDICYSNKYKGTIDRVAYICVYNKDTWRPVYWAPKRSDHSWVFPKMGRALLYMIAAYRDGELTPLSCPFKLNEDGTITSLDGHKQTLARFNIKSLASPIQMQIDSMSRIKDKKKFDEIMRGIAEGKIVRRPTVGMTYELRIWKGRWITYQMQVCQQDGLSFTNVPGGGLYRIACPQAKDSLTRVFTYDTCSYRLVWL